ncbi:hypothetical protein IAU60_000755 [Kwoniella sp. DSM 27419]
MSPDIDIVYIGTKRGIKRGRDTESEPCQKVVWLSPPTDPKPPPQGCTWTSRDRQEACRRTTRAGLTYAGVQYEPGDAISLTFPGQVSPTFALIRSIFTEQPEHHSPHIPPKHYCHVHLLKSSSIGGAGRKGELFLDHGRCQDVPLAMILQGRKLDFQLIGNAHNQKIRNDREWFCQFVDQPSRGAIREPATAEAFGGCDSCLYRHQKTKNEELYHTHDFVLIDSRIQGVPYIIGHIEAVALDHVQVRLLKRRSELDAAKGPVSVRQLVITDEHSQYPLDRVMSKTTVFPSSPSTSQGTSRSMAMFCDERLVQGSIVPLRRPLQSCGRCTFQHSQSQQDLQDVLRLARFPASDYYSGAGGFLLPGLPTFDWYTVIDTDEAACRTLNGLKRRASHLKVLRGTVQEQYVRASRATQSEHPLALPDRGSIFLMTGGPPCQGHSRANHNNTASVSGRDSRNDELFVFLAEVVRVRPYVVLIENVGAFKDDRTDDAAEEESGNYARRAMKELCQAGYSARLGILDARDYGSPQNRRRCFVLATRIGLPLPSFPTPTHANPQCMATIFRDQNGKAVPFYMGDGRKGTRGTGAFPPVTIDDAISDLPSFDYAPSPQGLRSGARPRERPRPDARRHPMAGNDTRVGFSRTVPYALPAQNDYQKNKREVASPEVRDHYTSYCTQGALGMIFDQSEPENSKPGCKRRALASDGFSTLLTSSAPGGKGTAVIHPSQDRKFTIAERKRAMGWPDWHVLAGTPLDQERLTGNGVCFETVEAIYTTIVKEIILPWWVRAGKPKDQVFEKFCKDHP